MTNGSSTNMSFVYDSSSSDWEWKRQVYNQMWFWAPPPTIAFGLVCNACTLLVLMQRRMRAMVVHLPLAVLAVIDSLILLLGLMRHWLRKAPYFKDNFGNSLDPQTLCAVCCSVLEMALYLCLMYSSWIILIIAVERFAAICLSPASRQRAFLISRKGITVMLLLALVLVASVNSHFVFTRKLDFNSSDDGQRHCINRKEFSFFLEEVFPRIDMALTAFVPFLVIFVCNLLIIKKLKLMRQPSMLSSGRGSKFSTTVMLLLMTFAFIVLTGPAKIYLLIVGGVYPRGLTLSTDPSGYYTYRIIWSVLLGLQYSNNCCNFLLYSLSNSLFRREVMRLIATRGCKCTAQTQRSSLPSVSDATTRNSQSPAQTGSTSF